MLIVFEGIDGSGKTTLSNRVAQELRQAGLRVRHVREGGTLASAVSEDLRRFTRDPAHLALTPTAELLLYAAREAQLLEEVTRPALAEYEIVITDRFLYTAEVLARWGRGLPEHVVRPVVEACRARPGARPRLPHGCGSGAGEGPPPHLEDPGRRRWGRPRGRGWREPGCR